MFQIFRSAPAPVKTFTPPVEFEYNLHLALRLMACESRGNFACTIDATGDTVTLRINGIENLGGLARQNTPGAYQHFFCHPTYAGGSLRLTFHEPDCYIFGCLPEGMQYDLDQHAPNARIASWTEKVDGRLIRLEFAPFDWEQETARWAAFEQYYNIWCK